MCNPEMGWHMHPWWHPEPESFFFSSRRRHTRFDCDWSSDVCSSDLNGSYGTPKNFARAAPIEEFQVKIPAIGAALAKFFGVPYEPFKPDRIKPMDLLKNRSEERRVGKEGRSRWSPYH